MWPVVNGAGLEPGVCEIFLVAALLEGGESEFWRDFFALRPIVVGVALKAAGFGMVGTGGVAGLAGGDAGHHHVG